MPKSPLQPTASTRITRAATRPSPSKPNKLNEEQRPRKQARCNICEGHPLRTECEHTVTGRLHLFTLGNTAPENELPMGLGASVSDKVPGPDKAPGRCSRCTGRPLRSQCCHTKAGRLFMHEQSVLADLHALPHQPSTPNDEGNLHALPGPWTPNVGDNIPYRTDVSDSVIDPALRDQFYEHPPRAQSPLQPAMPSMSQASNALREQPHEQGPPQAQSPMQPTIDMPMSQASNTQTEFSTPSASSATPLNNSVRRARASAANPSFGHVEGVYRGEAPHSIHRGHALPRRIGDRDKCQKQFLETANSIITRCEDLSAQTGCWLFIGIQHATARGAPIHYASPRIRRDAPDAISDFASEFCTMMNDVMDVRRRDTFEVQQNLHAIQLEKESMERELALLRSKDVDREARLNQYKNLFGTLDIM